MDMVEHSLNGPAENQNFPVNAGTFPGPGAPVPGTGPASQQMRTIPIHASGIPPQVQQQTIPQQPTPTSTPPATDMGKTTQNFQSVNYVPSRPQNNQYFSNPRMAQPQANQRIQGRIPAMNLNTMSLAAYPYVPFPTISFANPTNPVSQLQSAYPPPRQHNQTPSGQPYFTPPAPSITYQVHHSNPQFYQQIPYQMASQQYMRGSFTGPSGLSGQSQLNMAPIVAGPPSTMNHSHTIVNQPTTQPTVVQQPKGSKRSNAISIIDPKTGKDIFEDDSDNNGGMSSISPPQSNDSSARETPQPGSSSHENDSTASSDPLELRDKFAALVKAAVSDETKPNSAPSSIPDVANGPENLEPEINPTVPSDSVKNSKLSISHTDDYSSVSQVSDIEIESTGHKLGSAVNHGNTIVTPVVSFSALANTAEKQPNWQVNHPRESFPSLKNTSSNVMMSGKNNFRKPNRVSSESERNTVQDKVPPQIQPPSNSQSVPPAQIVSGSVVKPTEQSVTTDSLPVVSQTTVTPPASTPVTPVVSTPTSTHISAPTKKEKNIPTKTTVANTSKEEAPVTSQHPILPPKERREKQRPVKEMPQPSQIHVQPDHTPKPSSSDKNSSKNVSHSPGPNASSTSAPNTVNVPMPAPVTVLEEKAPTIQQQHTNGETPIEPSEGKASQRQGNKRKQKMKDINRKGVEKEGSEMDAFTGNSHEEKEKSAPPAPVVNNQSSAISNKMSAIEKTNKDELEDKMVAAKNEENAKVSALQKTDDENAPTTIIEKTQPPIQPQLKFKYKEDQWSPINPDGKKKYDRDFLLNLQSQPQSTKRPENLPIIEVVLQDHTNRRLGSSQSSYISRVNDFTPNFIRSGQSQRQIPPRKSQNREREKGGRTGGKSSSMAGGGTLYVTLKDDIKLRETENAWRPTRLQGNKEVAEEDRKTQDLYKKVRSILNKLTPQKFETLVNQVRALPIDTSERLQGVINLVFDKAIDEPGFAKAYANMCKLVANMEVKEGKNDQAQALVFRKLLLARCQSEFESNKAAELNSEKRLQDIEMCTDPEKKKELQLNYEEEERRIRRKSVGNIRFIGELFKLGMLTSNIMHRCIVHLLSKHEEESLECLCKLLTTIGKDLEASKEKDSQLPSLDGYFNEMSDLAHKRDNSKVSSRVRFMLQDVIELRQSKWVPRRDDNNPKTIDQINRDADRESMELSIALSGPPRKQDIRGSDSDRKGRNRNMNQQEDKDGWQNVGGKNYRPNPVSYSFDASRLQSFKQQPSEMMPVSFGSASQYTHWRGGASSKSSDKSDNRIVGNNMYNALSKDQDNKRHSNVMRSTKTTPSPSIEKERMLSGYKEVIDSERQSQRGQHSSQPPSRDRTPARANPTVPSTPTPSSPPLGPDGILRKAKLIAEEYLCNNYNFEEAKQTIEDFDKNPDILLEILIYAVNNNALTQAAIGKLFASLTDNSFLKPSLVLSLYVKLLDQIVSEEWIIDIPLIWSCFTRLLAPLVKADKFSFGDVFTISKSLHTNKKAIFLPLLQILCEECGEDTVRNKWNDSKMKLNDFISDPNDPKVQKTVEFLFKKGDSSMSMKEVEKQLINFLRNDVDFDDIVKWISSNVGKKENDPVFIRALMTAVNECSIGPNKKVIESTFKKHEKLIRRFVDQNEELQVQCLSAIQAFVHNMEYPSGLLLSLFNFLWEDGVINNDAFIKWRDSDCLGEGKGVAVKCLTSFFAVLKETEVSDENS